MVRGRDAASAIVEQACVTGAEMVVVGGVRKARRGSRAPVFGRTVQHVLKRAPCPVMVVAADRDAAGRAA
jgi:nucleotide-binding universal stress UspA family protein